ncbi:MAG: phosphate ABC transporter substrate-binding protein [Pseudomonadota bacterium]
MPIKFIATVLLSLALGAAGGPARAGELIVIVSAKNPLTALTAEQASDIFLGQSLRFPNGSEVAALDQTVGVPIRDEFYAKLTGKSPALIKAYWAKMIFTGRAQPPREVDNSVAIRKMVADNPGLIGYIDKSALDPSVKAVLVIR